MSFGRNWLRYYRGLVSLIDVRVAGHNLQGRRGLETVLHHLAEVKHGSSGIINRLLLCKITRSSKNNDDRIILQFDGAGGAWELAYSACHRWSKGSIEAEEAAQIAICSS
jgi:hypothetical protein